MPCASLPGLRALSGARRSGKKSFMAEEKTGRKPDKEGGPGMEKPEADSAEAGPRSKRMAYTCWNDGAANYVSEGWEWFTCWRCGSLVYV
jgi:hypothetical protein